MVALLPFAALWSILGMRQVRLSSDSPVLNSVPDYGIGFDFTPSYGAVAVSFLNGSNVPLARVEGDESWTKLMAKVSLEFNFAYCAPCVSKMADMLRALAAAGSEHLGKPIGKAAATMPTHITTVQSPWPPPVDRLLRNAFIAAGIEYMQVVETSTSGEPVLYPENSVPAAHGMGLCQDWNLKCRLPRERFLNVGYHRNAFEITSSSNSWHAGSLNAWPSVDYRLGAEARHEFQNETLYWQAIRQQLWGVLRGHRSFPPTKIIMYGEYARDAEMVAVVMEMLDMFPSDRREWVVDSIDPVFAGALGAAEFAKRKPFLA